jgi:hypothetical protein
MKNDRVGDWLWEEWIGEGYESSNSHGGTVYCTTEWVDIDNDLIKRALASCLQRDGVVDSLSEGFKVAESAIIVKSYAGFLEEEKTMTICNESGETEFGDSVSSKFFITLVEF